MRRRFTSNNYKKQYLTIEALEDGLQAKLLGSQVLYSIDEGNTWTSLAPNTYTPTVNSGQTIMFKSKLIPSMLRGIGKFTISKKCNLKGNCNSLLFGDDASSNNSLSGKSYAFYELFRGCTTIVEVSSTFLPATTLAYNCYELMFYGCTSLTTAPELPATTLATDCYCDMFRKCTSLTEAPSILPATTLADYCYRRMFYDCTSLTIAPELPATTLANGCYSQMFQYCSKLNYIKAMFVTPPSGTFTYNWVNSVASSGTFVKNKNATWNVTGASGIPEGWTVQIA